jgi:hypothetical protein
MLYLQPFPNSIGNPTPSPIDKIRGLVATFVEPSSESDGSFPYSLMDLFY